MLLMLRDTGGEAVYRAVKAQLGTSITQASMEQRQHRRRPKILRSRLSGRSVDGSGDGQGTLGLSLSIRSSQDMASNVIND